MPAPRARIGSHWMSPTDIRLAITKIAADRNRLSNIHQRINGQVESHRAAVESSLKSIDPKDRPAIVTKATNGRRRELVAETAEARVLLTREMEGLRQRVASASTHYRSPVQMLMRETLGSERRSRIMQQIASSGPAELASLAELAAAQGDKELAAALCSRVADVSRADRPFSAGELAGALLGELHAELSQALVQAERCVLEGLEDEQVATTGRGNPQRALQVAMLKKREREIGAYEPDDEADDDQTAAD